ncbi:hypothetical protein TNCV_4466911, partial [Trichonephila clavipes]
VEDSSLPPLVCGQERALFWISTATEHLKRPFPDWLVDTRNVSPSLRAGRLLSSAQVQGSAGLCRTYPGLSGSFQRRLVRFSPSCYRFFEGQQFNGSCLTSSDN